MLAGLQSASYRPPKGSVIRSRQGYPTWWGYLDRNEWARLESNQHALAGTCPSSMRVCLFRHEPISTNLIELQV